ncbi:hypothetical protein KAV67_03945 [Candidatus Bipolaricaulota bacterium]|nr:hypothetical protein [Candidatus Bipolaricaulota bacterium]
MEPFTSEKPLIGMIHLLPLPGSARYTKGGMPLILGTVLRNLEALETGRLTQRLWKTSGMSRLPNARRLTRLRS